MLSKLRAFFAVGVVCVALAVWFGVSWLTADGKTGREGISGQVITASDLSLILPDKVPSIDEFLDTGFKPRPTLPAWPISIPVNWRADPFSDNNWQFQFHAWVMINPYIKAYFKDNKIEHLRDILPYVEDWYAFHYEKGRKAKYSWFDMATGIRAMKLTLLIDRINSGALSVSDDTKTRLLDMARDHAARLQVDSFVSRGNHGLFQMLGLQLLCTTAPAMKECRGAEAFAAAMVEKVIRGSYTDQGVHKEHSPSYAFQVTDWLNNPAFLRWWPELVKSVTRHAYDNHPWFVFPNGRVAALGDSSGQRSPLSKSPEHPVCVDEAKCYAVNDLTASGYAIIKSLPEIPVAQQSMLFVTGAAWSLSHKHIDDLSFELFEHGRMIFIDSGIYSYTTDEMRGYVVGPSAHNTVSLDDVHIGRNNLELIGSELESLDLVGSGFEIRGQVNRPDFFSQKRVITYEPGTRLTVKDSLSADKTQPFVSSLHLAPDLEASLEDRSFSVSLGDGHFVRGHVLEPDCRVVSARGEKDPYLGWSTVKYLKMEPTTVIRALCPGKERTITWDISLN